MHTNIILGFINRIEDIEILKKLQLFFYLKILIEYTIAWYIDIDFIKINILKDYIDY